MPEATAFEYSLTPTPTLSAGDQASASGAFTSDGTLSEEEPVEDAERRVYNVVTSDKMMALTRDSVRSQTSAGVKRWGE